MHAKRGSLCTSGKKGRRRWLSGRSSAVIICWPALRSQSRREAGGNQVDLTSISGICILIKLLLTQLKASPIIEGSISFNIANGCLNCLLINTIIPWIWPNLTLQYPVGWLVLDIKVNFHCLTLSIHSPPWSEKEMHIHAGLLADAQNFPKVTGWACNMMSLWAKMMAASRESDTSLALMAMLASWGQKPYKLECFHP